MSARHHAVLVILLSVLACAPERVVIVDDEVPLAMPLEADLAEAAPAREQEDPPARAIRLDLAEGGVSRQPQGVDAWAPATVNLPLGAGDSLWVPPGGRAELHAGATGMRLAQATGLDVLRYDDRSIQVGLPQGSLELRILPDRDVDSVEVDTPAGAVLLERAGAYRVDADPDGPGGRVTVRSGLAEVTAGGTTVQVQPGHAMELSGGDSPTYDLVQAREPDPFDQWCAGREAREDRSESALYVGRATTGYEDLDGQGSWQVTPVYGSAWVPRVPDGWAPFRQGRWVWADPWGWTWVDDAPWGYATSHYGRWAWSGSAWMWIPHADGMGQARPVYAPAVVAFAGGPGFRGKVSAGGGVAWFPLAPREPYLPAYPASRAYVQGLNAPSFPGGAFTLATASAHANQSVPGAMTVVPQSVFVAGGPVAPSLLAVRSPALAKGVRVGSAPALVPRQESVLGALPGAAPAAAPPPGIAARALMVRARMPQVPVPFEARQQALAVAHGRPLAAPALGGLRAQGQEGRPIPARLATAAGPGGPLRPLPRPAEPQPQRPVLGPGPAAGPEPGLRPATGPEPGLRPAPGGRPRQARNPKQRNRPRRLGPGGQEGPEAEGNPGPRRPAAQRQGRPGRGPREDGRQNRQRP